MKIKAKRVEKCNFFFHKIKKKKEYSKENTGKPTLDITCISQMNNQRFWQWFPRLSNRESEGNYLYNLDKYNAVNFVIWLEFTRSYLYITYFT